MHVSFMSIKEGRMKEEKKGVRRSKGIKKRRMKKEGRKKKRRK